MHKGNGCPFNAVQVEDFDHHFGDDEDAEELYEDLDMDALLLELMQFEEGAEMEGSV